MSNRLEKTQKLAFTAIFSAIIVVVSFLPLKTLGLEITFSMVPVAIGAVLYGPAVGSVLGGVFGIVSFLQCFGYSGFGVLLMSENPFFTFLVCVPTRILAGLLAGLIASALRNVGKGRTVSGLAASLAAPLVNTVLFMSVLVMLFWRGDTIQGFADTLGTANPFLFIILFVGINGLIEIISGFIVAFPVSKALMRYLKI